MTNGAVGETVTSVDGPVLTVKYKDGEKKIIVGPSVPVSRLEMADRSEKASDATGPRSIYRNAPPIQPHPASRQCTLSTRRVTLDPIRRSVASARFSRDVCSVLPVQAWRTRAQTVRV